MFIKTMTRQSSVPPPDDSDHSDSENPSSPEPRINKNENEKNTNETTKNEKDNEEEKKNNIQSPDSGNETGKDPNIKMDNSDENLPPKKRKRKLRKDMEPKKRTKTTEEKKTGAIIISLYDLLNMTEGGLGPPLPPLNNEKEPAPPDNPCGYHEEPYNYDSTGEDNFQMEVEEYLNLEIKNIDDLIKIGEDYIKGIYDPYKKYNINVYKISKLVKPLKKLQKMIGMQNVKQDVFELLLYQLQEFDNSKDMLHTIIEGEPGVGKTDLAKIMAEV